AFRSTAVPIRVPAFDQTVMLALTISTRTSGPAAICVSGGSMLLLVMSIPGNTVSCSRMVPCVVPVKGAAGCGARDTALPFRTALLEGTRFPPPLAGEGREGAVA